MAIGGSFRTKPARNIDKERPAKQPGIFIAQLFHKITKIFNVDIGFGHTNRAARGIGGSPTKQPLDSKATQKVQSTT